MKSKLWRQILSFVLAVIFVLELAPASALAVKSDTGLTTAAEAADLTASEEEAYVVGEVDELREEAVKHFRMNDGTFMAVQYDGPVHYRDADGEWQDIDNTLQRSGERYVTQNGAMTKSFAASLDSGLLFETSYQGYSVGMSLVTKLTGTVPVRPGLEIMEEIAKDTEADLPEEEATEEETNAEEITTPAEVQEQTEAPVETSEAQEAEAADPVVEEKPQQELGRFARVEAANVKAQVENPEPVKKVAGKTSTEQMITPEKLTSDIRFANVFENTDLIYQNHGYDIKESVIIKRQQDTYSYSFALNLGGLTPTLEEDGSVLLSNADGEGVFEIPAPYLQDANGELSGAAEYTLTETNGGWVLTVEADPEWLNANDRAFPVTLDPTILLKVYAATVATYIRSNAPTGTARDANNGSDSGDRYCGLINDSKYGTCQVFVEIASLPALPQNCVPVRVLLQRYHAAFYDSNNFSPYVPAGSLTVEAHEWKGSIDSIADLTWSAVYQGESKVDSTALDFQVLSKSTMSQNLTWDITNAAIEWYNDGSSKHYIALIPTDHEANQRAADLTMNKSQFIIQYRNPVGLEDYYTYQEASAGKAGNVYIHDFTQQMTVDHTDVSFSSEATPYTLRHVYNTATAGVSFGNDTTFGIHSCNFSSMKTGNGWKLSAQQTVVPVTVGTDIYLVYNDEDGTEHYFQETSTNTYEDEDGLGLKIVKSTSGSNTIYTMTDTDAYHTWVFHNGYLISLTDSNSNAIYFAYNNAYSSSSASWKPTTGTTNKLVQIVARPNASTSGATIIASLAYNGAYLDTITDYAGRATTYAYSDGNLTNITYPDGTTVTYQYSGLGGKISELYDGESQYGVTVSYWDRTCNPVYKVEEFAVNSSGNRLTGNAFHAFRNAIHLTSYRFYGADHTQQTVDDVVTYCVLDHYGKTINTYDLNHTWSKLLGVTAATYTKNSGTSAKNNRLTGAAALGQSAINLLENGGMEKGEPRTANAWSATYFGLNDKSLSAFGGTESNVTRTGKGGLKSYLKPNSANSTDMVGMYQRVQLQKDVTYTLSGYINTSEITSFPTGSGVYLAFLTEAELNSAALAKQTTVKSEVIDYNTSEDIDGGWERVSVTFTPTTGGEYYAAYIQDNAPWMAYCDDLQLEAAEAASGTNLLQDGTFDLYEDNTNVTLTYWTQNRYQSVEETPMKQSFQHSMTAVGGTNGYTRMNQVVPVNKSAKETTFILSGWGKADSVAGTAKEHTTGTEKYFGLVAEIQYTDGTKENHYVSFNDDFNGWQFASGIVVPKQSDKTIDTITVHCAYDYNANRVYFSNISLIQEPVQTYSYDEKGNPVAATDGNAKTAYEYFSGTSKLKNYTTPSETKHELTYDAHNNLESDTLGGLTNYTYRDDFGNVTNEMTRVKYSGPYLQATNTYDSTGSYKIRSTDLNGIETTYLHNNTYRWLISATNPNNIAQGYVYDASNSRNTATYVDGLASIGYHYENGRIDQLTRNTFPEYGNTDVREWQRYSLVYDAFGNTQSIGVSGSTDGANYTNAITLASYAYEPSVNGVSVNNGRLSQMTYANGDTVNYAYDQFDRKTAETYNDGTTNHYVYASDGSLARQYATNTNGTAIERYSYQYDSLGRLIHSRKLDGTGATVLSTEHLYDTSNRLTSQSWQFGGGAAYQQEYAYSVGANGNGTLTTLKNTTAAGADTVTYGYNSLRQLTSKTTSGAASFTRAYTYPANEDWTLTQVATMDYKNSSGTRILGYQYTYNALGNISLVSVGKAGSTTYTLGESYTYDDLGQLKKATDYSPGVRIPTSYEYTYDTAGNIQSAKKTTRKLTTTGLFPVSTVASVTERSYSYENASWRDLLTSVKIGTTSKAITYPTDGNGNVTAGTPMTWYNGSDYTFTWKQGTQLASAMKGSVTTTYDYDMSGVRSRKTVGSTTYDFATLSGLVMRQTWDSQTLDFVYDDSNQPYALVYKSSSTATPVLYYYVLNQQGDVMALMNTGGTIVAQYRYDPWGVPTVVSDTSNKSIATLNPLRYRGYYYDTETGFYYLQSRYYDPANARFISADTFATTDCNGFLSANMFAYCENNPVNGKDPNGEWVQFAIGAAVGAVVGGISAAISSYNSGGQINVRAVLLGAGIGAVGGLIGASGLSTGLQAAASGLLSAVNNVGSAYIQGQNVNWRDVAADAVIGAGSSLLGSVLTKKSVNAADKLIAKGIDKISIGKARYDSGSRYWKGTVKKGFRYLKPGIRKLHIARGRASVIGSTSGGAISIFKSWLF